MSEPGRWQKVMTLWLLVVGREVMPLPQSIDLLNMIRAKTIIGLKSTIDYENTKCSKFARDTTCCAIGWSRQAGLE